MAHNSLLKDAGSSRLQRLLMKHQVGKGQPFTHTSIGKPAGSFYIPVELASDFHKAYVDALDSGEELHLTEKHRHISPVLVDLDFRFATGSKSMVRQYNNEHIKQIVSCYCLGIASIFEESSFKAYVMEKPSPQRLIIKSTDTKSQSITKDGIHIVFPTIVSKPSAQYILRNKVIPELEPIFKELSTLNNTSDVVDEAIIERNNWLLYGSRKPGGEAYKITHVYEFVKATSTLTEQSNDDISNADVISLLSIRNKHDETLICPDALDAIRKLDEEYDSRKRKMELARTMIADDDNTKQNECENIEEVNALVDILSVERCNNYNDWMRLGWCLRNIDHRLLAKWEAYSSKSPKYKNGECETVWRKMRIGGGLGIGSLHMWAKQDSPEKYNEIIRLDLRKLIYESKSGTHTDVARVVRHMYKHEYVCASIKNKLWYEFKSHRWVSSDCAFSLRVRMSNEVWKEYVSAATSLSSRAIDAVSAEEQERFHEIVKKLHGVATKLKVVAFKDNVIKECAEMFYVEKFEDQLDSNDSLIGFENGVYDLDTMEFREGRPEDYLSFSTGIPYIPYDASHPNIIAIKEYMNQVLTKPQVREYVLKLFATFLHGAVKEQKFYIWTGSGCHAYDTCIMMYDGHSKKVQDVCVGDRLMGDDSTPRIVKQLYQGHDVMYKIIPEHGDAFIVNGDHVLSLKLENISKTTIDTWNNKVIVTWNSYEKETFRLLSRVKWFNDMELATAFAVNIPEIPATVDLTVKNYLKVQSVLFTRAYLYRPSYVEYPLHDTNVINPYETGVASVIGLINLPTHSKFSSKESRQLILAGIIDSMETTYDANNNWYICTSVEECPDAISIARSLGLTAYKLGNTKSNLFQMSISGSSLHEIPTKHNELIKQNDQVNERMVSFQIEKLDTDNYYGFEVDRNNRYLMEDFIVTHNSNSKSLCVNLFEKAFGDYCCKFPITLLTQKRAASNAATSELARAKGKRFASLQEPSEGEHINCGLMKELSGGDKIMARSLYKEPFEFVPQFKMLLLCNHLPQVPSDDGGTWRRIRVVEFTSKFVENPVEENEFPIDYDLPKKLDSWKSHFMSLLIEYYGLYKQEGIFEPEEILACTREYKRQNDHLADFIYNCIEKKEGLFMSLNDAFIELKNWVKDDNIQFKVPTKSDLEKYLSKNLTKCVNNPSNNTKGFKGYRLRNRYATAVVQDADGID